jgi:hypothetical protein
VIVTTRSLAFSRRPTPAAAVRLAQARDGVHLL